MCLSFDTSPFMMAKLQKSVQTKCVTSVSSPIFFAKFLQIHNFAQHPSA